VSPAPAFLAKGKGQKAKGNWQMKNHSLADCFCLLPFALCLLVFAYFRLQ